MEQRLICRIESLTCVTEVVLQPPGRGTYFLPSQSTGHSDEENGEDVKGGEDGARGPDAPGTHMTRKPSSANAL